MKRNRRPHDQGILPLDRHVGGLALKTACAALPQDAQVVQAEAMTLSGGVRGAVFQDTL